MSPMIKIFLLLALAACTFAEEAKDANKTLSVVPASGDKGNKTEKVEAPLDRKARWEPKSPHGSPNGYVSPPHKHGDRYVPPVPPQPYKQPYKQPYANTHINNPQYSSAKGQSKATSYGGDATSISSVDSSINRRY